MEYTLLFLSIRCHAIEVFFHAAGISFTITENRGTAQNIRQRYGCFDWPASSILFAMVVDDNEALVRHDLFYLRVINWREGVAIHAHITMPNMADKIRNREIEGNGLSTLNKGAFDSIHVNFMKRKI